MNRVCTSWADAAWLVGCATVLAIVAAATTPAGWVVWTWVATPLP